MSTLFEHTKEDETRLVKAQKYDQDVKRSQKKI